MFRLQVNVLTDADLKTATKLILVDAAADSAREWKSDDVVSEDSSTGRWICKSPEILDELFKMIIYRIYDMNAPKITPEVVLDKFIYWMDLRNKEVAHVDGNPGTKGFVAVLSVGASAVLSIRTSPGDQVDDALKYVEVTIPVNSLYLLKGFDHMHVVRPQDGSNTDTRGVYLVFFEGKADWPTTPLVEKFNLLQERLLEKDEKSCWLPACMYSLLIDT